MDAISSLFIRFIADYLVVPIVIIGAWVVLASPRPVRMKRIMKGVLAGVTALILALLASLAYHDERPFLASGAAAKASYLISTSFPSLHALLVFTATFVVWAATKNAKVSLLLLVLSVLVAVGRIVALVHTPLDVLGGVACAFVAVLIIYGKTIFTTDLKE
jgi:undecaprenyl-diphosphatase